MRKPLSEDTWSDPLISILRRSDGIYFHFIDFTEEVHDEEDLQQEPAESVVRIATWFDNVLPLGFAHFSTIKILCKFSGQCEYYNRKC